MPAQRGGAAPISSLACPRCVWERTASGYDAPILLRIALRAHAQAWHPGLEIRVDGVPIATGAAWLPTRAGSR